ncbi:MAG: sirohydrochlorin cobaltochelatase [Thermodesulfobacteriota bacterium]
MNRLSLVVALIMALGLSSVCLGAKGKDAHGAKEQGKSGILLVVFGTTVPEARKAFDQIGKQVKEAFPGVELRWAYTSKVIRAKLKKEGQSLDSPEAALARMADDGFSRVLAASFHTIPGEEFHDLQKNAHMFAQMRGGIKHIVVSRPLLSSRSDFERVMQALLREIPKSRKPDEAVIFMGHGSEHHPSDVAYAAMNYWFGKAEPNVLVGTVSGEPKLEDFLPELKKKGVKKAYLLPFMSVAGDHARNDMCGDEPESWKSILKKAGIESQCILKGTAEMPDIVSVWIDHMKAAFSLLPR